MDFDLEKELREMLGKADDGEEEAQAEEKKAEGPPEGLMVMTDTVAAYYERLAKTMPQGLVEALVLDYHHVLATKVMGG